MAYDGVILYGPPASGKDTITAELVKLVAAYVYYPPLKHGDGRQVGYRSVTADQLDSLRRRGQVVYESQRYGATYVIERESLDASFGGGQIPIVHLGRLAGVDALCAENHRWLLVRLWCPRAVSESRLGERGQPTCADRLAVWDEMAADLSETDRTAFTLAIRTDHLSAPTAAHMIEVARRD